MLNFILVWLSDDFFFASLPGRTRRTILPRIHKICRPTEFGFRANNHVADSVILKRIKLELKKHECLVVGTVAFAKSPRPITNTILSNSVNNSFFRVSVEVLAKQMTLIDQTAFHSIPIIEYLDKAWERPRYCGVNDNTRSWIDRFNAGSEYFITQILSSKGEEERIHRVNHIAKLGKTLLDMNNFMSAAMVTFALSHISLKNIESLWRNLPKNTVGYIDELIVCMSHAQNYANYRKRLQKVHPVKLCRIKSDDRHNILISKPCIPNLLVHHKDIFYEHESYSMKTGIKNSHISFQRSRLLGKQLLLLHNLRKNVYVFKTDIAVALMLEQNIKPRLSFLESNKTKSQNQIYCFGKTISHHSS